MAREQRLVFGEVADLYDRSRPGYPASLVDEVVSYAGLTAGDAVLEVGCGTGKATVPFAAREFVRTDRVFVRFGVYGQAAAGAAVTAQLTNRFGTPLVAMPVVALGDGEGTYQIEWPLASQARGDYLIAIEAAKGEEKARVLVPLRVVP